MNDGSTDETARVARSYGATVVDVVDDTDGNGMGNHMLVIKVTHAYESYCFADADVTFLRKDAVETLINQYQLQGEKGLLSVQPII